jgi:hypothetical protein
VSLIGVFRVYCKPWTDGQLRIQLQGACMGPSAEETVVEADCSHPLAYPDYQSQAESIWNSHVPSSKVTGDTGNHKLQEISGYWWPLQKICKVGKELLPKSL